MLTIQSITENSVSRIFEIAAKIGNEWSLAAFAVAALILIALIFSKQKLTSKNLRQNLTILVIAVVAIATFPLVARAYLETHGVYRVRVTVEDDQGIPRDDSRVTCSIGGEPKAVEGGWEFEIPPGSKPADGRLTIYAKIPSAFLSGKVDLELSKDYNVATKIRLDHDRSARVRGQVFDQRRDPVPGARVEVIGYPNESVVTGLSGEFELPAHAADSEEVQVTATREGVGSVSEWVSAGEHPATVILQR